ncbi:glycosyltransferase family 2 protein, partial [Slackia equolifaciens]
MAKKTATVSQDASKSCKGAVGGAHSAASDAVSDNAQHGAEAHSSHDGGASPAVSVIIPVYNVQRYLRECLESVLAQTLRGIEVLCVNDGSTDSSLSIMREYEARDPRVRVVDKPNG